MAANIFASLKSGGGTSGSGNTSDSNTDNTSNASSGSSSSGGSSDSGSGVQSTGSQSDESSNNAATDHSVLSDLDKELARKIAAGAPAEEIDALKAKINLAADQSTHLNDGSAPVANDLSLAPNIAADGHVIAPVAAEAAIPIAQAPEKSYFTQLHEAQEKTIEAIEGSGRTGPLTAHQAQHVRNMVSDKLGTTFQHDAGLTDAYENTLQDPLIVKTIEQEAGLSRETSSPVLANSLALVAANHGIGYGTLGSVLWDSGHANVSAGQTMTFATPQVGGGAGKTGVSGP